MMVNRRRGEIGARLDGRDYRLCLTLGALAELETAFSTQDINGLVKRFSSGQLSSRDMAAIIGAGLRGGGNDLSDEQVLAMACDDGVVGFARIVSELLAVTFGEPEGSRDANPPTPQLPNAKPFPGVR